MLTRVVLALVALVALSACQDGATPARVATPAAPASTETAVIQAGAAPEGITVSGRGAARGEPDTLRATVGVHVVRPDVEQAFDDAATAAERVVDAVRDHGVAEEDIQTREVSVSPEQEHRPDGSTTTRGYVVRNLVEVVVRDLDRAGELLAAVADVAGDDARIEGLHLSLEDNEALLRAAREQAVDDARRKAEHYAELAGAGLGALIDLTEVTAELPPPIAVPESAADEQRAAAPVMPGQQEIGVQVRATWSLR
jgi:uncharacterized protein